MRHRTLWICLSLLALTAIAYAPIRHAGFINYDDNVYVQDFDRVHRGLTADNVRWAMTATYFANWHPLTWLSYMLDCQLFGVDATKMHLENAALDAANALVLFLFLQSSTRRPWRSATVAALFAVHPMHVESVAWIAERKDVLSTLFLLLSMWAYIAFARRTGLAAAAWYAVMLACYALSLAAKSMGVTLPALLLLWDLWPLARANIDRRPPTWPILILEKTPLLCLAFGAAALAVVAQRHTGSVATAAVLPLSARVDNAAVAYVQYIAKLLVPQRLAVFYPLTGSTPTAAAVASLLLLLVVTVLTIRQARRRPYLTVGWIWFLVSLLPVIGFVQVGAQSMADRYTYLPSIGLFIVIVWASADLSEAMWHNTARSIAAGVLGGAAVGVAVILTVRQVGYWKDSETLFAHALAVTDDNWVAHHHLGLVYGQRGDYAAAANEFIETLRIRPDYADSCIGLGNCLLEANPAAAIPWYQKAADLRPDEPGGHLNLANALLRTAKLDDAEAQYRRVLQIDPSSIAARDGLAAVQANRNSSRGG